MQYARQSDRSSRLRQAETRTPDKEDPASGDAVRAGKEPHPWAAAERGVQMTGRLEGEAKMIERGRGQREKATRVGGENEDGSRIPRKCKARHG